MTLSASGTSSLRARYLSVFLAVKFADWLQGPYFYTVRAARAAESAISKQPNKPPHQVYAGKIDPTTGELLSKSQISSLFVVGFTSTMVFGTILGSMADSWGRRASCCVCLLLTVASCTRCVCGVCVYLPLLQGTHTTYPNLPSHTESEPPFPLVQHTCVAALAAVPGPRCWWRCILAAALQL